MKNENVSKNTISEKRLDLQGIRGIAIISVLGFHFLPDVFPNGYVGVDQFFVLSGFLMCMLLQKSYQSPNFTSIFQWISNFYIRRLKRIVPLYFLLIFLALLSIFTIFPYTVNDYNVTSGMRALVFMSNRGEAADEDYWALLSIAIDVFTHTWSLSVEVQFYLLVPFLYLVGSFFSDKLVIAYYVVLGSASLIYSSFFCTETEAFHSVFARVWQFSIGILAYLVGEILHPEISEKSECYKLLPETSEMNIPDSPTPSHTKLKLSLTLLMITLIIFPIEFPSQYFRCFITISTGFLIIFPHESLLEIKFLTYSGNISYSLYLIHWPIYSYWKLHYGHDVSWNWQLVTAFGLSILLAVLSYELFEKWYLHQPNSTILILSSILFALNVGLLYQNDISELISPPEASNRLDGLKDGEVVSYYKASQLYRLWSRRDSMTATAPSCQYEDGHGPLGFCRHTGLDTKNGSFKLMIIGNSYAANHARLFYEECAYKAKSMVQQSFAGCEPLFPWTKDIQSCIEALDVFEQKVKKEKPDYLFIFSRFTYDLDSLPTNTTHLDTDHVLLKMKNQLNKYLPYVKYKVYMMNQIAEFNRNNGDHIAEAVLEKKDLVELDKSLVHLYPDMSRLRHEKLASECSKCELFDYKPYLFNETTQTWRFYDEKNSGLSYMTHGIHLSPHGLELIRPVIRDVFMENKNVSNNNPKEKRSDLQGIRGIAIISVLGFHFLPDWFPNGYVGVDQFFVLSGFLMCMLLRKSYQSLSFSSILQWILNFYIRRLKRIVPLYFLLIFIAMIAIFTIFPYTAIDSNIISGRRALMFMSNHGETEDEDYFGLLTIAIDVYTHTWSLSVEVQFYLLVPFLYLAGSLLSNKLEIGFYVVVGLASFIYSTFFCTEIEAFHSVFARVWQFCVGISAYLVVTEGNLEIPREYKLLPNYSDITVNTLPDAVTPVDGEIKVPEASYTKLKLALTLFIIALTMFPIELPVQYFRIFSTISTGFLIVYPSKLLLECTFLTCSGDISYSLYLIHWPIYACWKLNYGREGEWNWQLISAFGLSVVLAVLSYELFEKWYLQQPNSTILIFASILFTINLGLLYQNDVSEWIFPPESSTRLDGLKDGEVVSYYKAAKLYGLWSTRDAINMIAPTCEYETGNGPFGFCRHTGLDTKNGSFKLMLIGNSYAANHASLFYQECAYKAHTIVQESLSGCEPLFPSSFKVVQLKICTAALDVFVEKVKQEKPDYLFIFSRFTYNLDQGPANATHLNTDHVFLKMKSQLNKFLPYVKYKVLMMNQIARFDHSKGSHMADAVLEKKDLVEFDKSILRASPDWARLRYEKLASECSKCELFDYKPYFFNETTQTWRFYDEKNAGLSYMTHGTHLSLHGLELIRPVIRDVCRSL